MHTKDRCNHGNDIEEFDPRLGVIEQAWRKVSGTIILGSARYRSDV
jgi:hypothetical protein